MLNTPVLILNSGMIPIDIADAKAAIVLKILQKAISVKDDPVRLIRSQKLSFKLPRVVSLVSFHKIPRKKVVLSRLNIIYRDDMKCGYCGKRFSITDLTVDHIVPVSRWSAVPAQQKAAAVNSWENQVSACRQCNYRKGNQLLAETNMHLRVTPYEPKYMPSLVIEKKTAEKYGWLEFLTYNVKIVETIQ